MNTPMPVADALALLLDSMDYERGACSPTEMVGAVVPVVVLQQCRKALAADRDKYTQTAITQKRTKS